MALIKTAILKNRHVDEDKEISIHAEWIKSWRGKYRNINESTIDKIIQHEIGLRFGEVLSHAGVFKRNEHGMASFLRFITMTVS